MNKFLVFGSVGLLGVGGAVTGISYTSLNLLQEKDLIEELKLSKEQVEKYLEKIKSMIRNHKEKENFEIFLIFSIDSIYFEISNNNSYKAVADSSIEDSRRQIESKNLNKTEIKNIFKEIEFLILFIRSMYSKVSELKNKAAEIERKFIENRSKLEKYGENYVKNSYPEKSKSLLDFIIYVDQRILNTLYLFHDENVDNLKERFLIKTTESEQKLRDLIFENESFKNIEKDLETFLNLSIEFKKSSVFSEFFNEFLSDEIQQNINTWSHQNN